MAWYPQVRDCCGLGGVLPRVWARLVLFVGGGDGPDPGHGPCGGQRRFIHWVRQSMASPGL